MADLATDEVTTTPPAATSGPVLRLVLEVDTATGVITEACVFGGAEDPATLAALALARAVERTSVRAALVLSFGRMAGAGETGVVPGSLRARAALQAAINTALGVDRLSLDEAPASPDARRPRRSGPTKIERIRGIENAIAALRPVLVADRGDIELVEVDGARAFVHMTGACVGCQLAGLTLGGLQQRILQDLGELVQVVPVRPQR